VGHVSAHRDCLDTRILGATPAGIKTRAAQRHVIVTTVGQSWGDPARNGSTAKKIVFGEKVTH